MGKTELKLMTILLVAFYFFCSGIHSLKLNLSHQGAMELPETQSLSSICGLKSLQNHDTDLTLLTKTLDHNSDPTSLKLHVKHRSIGPKKTMIESTTRDSMRIQTLHRSIAEKKNQNALLRLKKDEKSNILVSSETGFSGQLTASLESGVSLGSGEYFIDVYVGTPPKHFYMILDTGSDLNWIQCEPCHDCFDQNGPHYNPNDSSSYRDISCNDPRCDLVSSPNPPQLCEKGDNQTCPYYYWYGDSSNTTGDFAVETFTVNLTTTSKASDFWKLENVMFGCGHWNRGLFHGAAGLLGLGRGPLSFSSQIQALYGHSFSYCLVDRNSNSSVSSKLIFGEDQGLLSHPKLNYTSLVTGEENLVDTFYYVKIKSVMVGGEVVNIPSKVWNLSTEGVGGTIIDSGTTLTYFAYPAYKAIKGAFMDKIKDYPMIGDFPILSPCYNVSGTRNLDFPSFSILFDDGAMWEFPVDNYFIWIEPEEVICLALMETPNSYMSIIGNYQQQNFHIMYDTKKSRIGFAPTRCAEI